MQGLSCKQMEIQGNSNEHHPSLIAKVQTIEHLELRDSNGQEWHEIENPHFISNWEARKRLRGERKEPCPTT